VPPDEFRDSMRKVLSNKINTALNELFTKESNKNIFSPEDFLDIFIVQDEFQSKRLLYCSFKLKNEISFCEETLCMNILEGEN
jgi:hypothetical protein